MPPMLANVAADAHLPIREIPRPSPAKAKLTAREIRENALGNKPILGAAFERAMDALGWDVKRTAIELGFVDDVTGEPLHAQVSRWIRGTEGIQLHRIWGTPLQGPFAIEQARGASGCAIHTTVTYTAVTR